MRWSIDARVPVRFGSAEDAEADDAVIAEAEIGQPGHAPACACCLARGPAGVTLGRLFERRARGEVPFFRRVLVVVSAAGRTAVEQALQDDPLASARFRLER